jgi:D-glycero-alpha-D-manno-heptose-7-phosphate kinase
MHQMVDEGLNILKSNAPIEDFGKLLHESWLLKKDLSSEIAPDFVDDIYTRALQAGAVGGKLLGAGGGGFMLFVVPPEKQINVLQKLHELLYVPIQFDFSGSQIIFYHQDQYTRTAMGSQTSQFVRYNAPEKDMTQPTNKRKAS